METETAGTEAIFEQDERQGAIELITNAVLNKQKAGFVGKDEIHYLDSFEVFEGFANGGMAQLPLFNLDTLPVKVKGFSGALCESLQVSPGMVGPAVLAIVATGAQKKYSIHPLEDWYEPANLYITIIAEPSERKSPTMKEILLPVYEYETEENEETAPKITAYNMKKKVLENRIESAVRSLSKSGKQKNDEKYLDMGDLDTLQTELANLEEVYPVRLVVDDVTMEVLAKLLGENKERIGVMSTEGGIFNILAGRYSEKTVIDIILKAYSGDKFSQDRLGRKGQALNSPLVTMLLYVQPIVIREVMENSEFMGRGLNARFLYSIPPSAIGKRRYRVMKISDVERMDYVDAIKRLYAIPVPDKPKVIELDVDADKKAEAFFYEVEKEMADASSEFKAWLGKIHGTTMRIALSLHCLEFIEESEFHKVSGETMENAIEMAKYFKAHAETAYNIMGLMDPPEIKSAKYIMKRIDSTGQMEITVRDLVELCKGKKSMDTREKLIPGIRCLIEHGYIRVQKAYPSSQNSQKPQKPKEEAVRQKLSM